MPLAAPEHLLSCLVREPAGVEMRALTPMNPEEMLVARETLVVRGHDIETSGRQWRLRCAARHFSPARFLELREGRWGEPLEVWESTPSTNDLAKQAALEGISEGAVWLAEEQTTGRGRQGRSWHCPAHSGLLFSLLLRPNLVPEKRPLLLPLALGLGVCEGVRRLSSADVQLKWPNDLLVGERKLAGLLVESRTHPSPFLVVGVGINVTTRREDFERHGLAQATSLVESPVDATLREQLLAVVLADLERRWRDWCEGSWAEILEAWKQHDALSGRTVRLQTANEILAGEVSGISESGRLQLQIEGGSMREFSAGEVHLS